MRFGLGQLGDLPAPQWGVSDYVVEGTTIDWGGNPHWGGDSGAGVRLSDIQSRLRAALLSTGRFLNLSFNQLGGTVNPYVTIRLTSTMDRAHLEDVLADIEGAFWSIGVAPGTQTFSVVSVPYTERPSVTPGTGGSTNPGATTSTRVPSVSTNADGSCPYPESLFCDCGQEWSMLKWSCVPISGASGSANPLDLLAEWLGVTPTQAAIVGALGALAVVVAVKRVL